MFVLNRIVFVSALALFGFLGFSGDLRAEDTARMHGIAMHGEPYYGADFTHLDYVNPDAPKGGRIRFGSVGSFDSVHAGIFRGRKAGGLYLTQDSLLARVWDEPFSLYGLVAETIEVPDDRSWIIFHLREEARWHDGEPMGVDDVIFSFETYKEFGRPNTRQTYGHVIDVDRIDDYTVRFSFDDSGDRELPLIIGMMPIISKDYWEGRDFEAVTLEPSLSSGPYRIDSVDAGRSITYKRVEDYWAADLPIMRGLYNFDIIKYIYYRDDDVALEAFRSGAYDFRRENNIAKWNSSYEGNALDEGRIIMEEIPHQRPEQARGIMLNMRRNGLDDERIRHALMLSFDFDAINQQLFGGAYRRITSYYPNSSLAAVGLPTEEELELLRPYSDEIPAGVFGEAWSPPEISGRRRLMEAVNLMQEAGFTYRGGKLYAPDSDEPFSLEILLNGSEYERIALAWRPALERIGIDLQISIVDSSAYIARVDEYDFDLTIHRWISSLSPGNEAFLYWGREGREQPATRNYPGIDNIAVNAIIENLVSAISSDELETAAHALDRVLTYGEYMIPLYYLGYDRVAYNSDIKHPEVTPIYGLVIESWYSEDS